MISTGKLFSILSPLFHLHLQFIHLDSLGVSCRIVEILAKVTSVLS